MFVLAKQEAAWVDLLPGVRVRFRPVTPGSYRRAMRAARAELDVEADEAAANDAAGEAVSRELIRQGIEAWEGIGDAAGVPAEVTPETVDLFLADVALFNAADSKYVAPFVLAQAEKNGSAPSPNGTSAGATAGQPIAGDAAPPRAKRARTRSTRRKPTTA